MSQNQLWKDHGESLPRDEESSVFRRPLTDDEWADVVRRVAERLNTLDTDTLRDAASRIEAAIQWLDPIMDRYCGLTCPTCDDSCCTGQRVFFNRADIITLVLLQGDFPPGQTREAEGDSCRYLGPTGCRLPRGRRPYVCVWFLCDPQMSLFQDESASFQRDFVRVLQEIRQARLVLESHYEEHFVDD